MFIIKKKYGVNMGQVGRKKIDRYIEADHRQTCFKPCGIRGKYLEKVILDFDEMEAIRLCDYEGLYQEECAQKMGISRTTFSRVIQQARKKVSEALLHGKAIVMRESDHPHHSKNERKHNENSNTCKDE